MNDANLAEINVNESSRLEALPDELILMIIEHLGSNLRAKARLARTSHRINQILQPEIAMTKARYQEGLKQILDNTHNELSPYVRELLEEDPQLKMGTYDDDNIQVLEHELRKIGSEVNIYRHLYVYAGAILIMGVVCVIPALMRYFRELSTPFNTNFIIASTAISAIGCLAAPILYTAYIKLNSVYFSLSQDIGKMRALQKEKYLLVKINTLELKLKNLEPPRANPSVIDDHDAAPAIYAPRSPHTVFKRYALANAPTDSAMERGESTTNITPENTSTAQIPEQSSLDDNNLRVSSHSIFLPDVPADDPKADTSSLPTHARVLAQ